MDDVTPVNHLFGGRGEADLRPGAFGLPVTVPVLSRSIVSTRRVDSRVSGPLIRIPSWAPRPVPTSSAVGVARPRAHGQAMMRTATAAVNAACDDAPMQQPYRERAEREHEHHGDEHRGDAVGQALHRAPCPSGPG